MLTNHQNRMLRAEESWDLILTVGGAPAHPSGKTDIPSWARPFYTALHPLFQTPSSFGGMWGA